MQAQRPTLRGASLAAVLLAACWPVTVAAQDCGSDEQEHPGGYGTTLCVRPITQVFSWSVLREIDQQFWMTGMMAS